MARRQSGILVRDTHSGRDHSESQKGPVAQATPGGMRNRAVATGTLTQTSGFETTELGK